MDTIVWKADLYPIDLDVRGVEHIRMDWTDWLNGETITAIEVEGTNITVQDITNVLTPEGHVDIKLSSATLNKVCTATVFVTTNTERRQPRSLKFIGTKL